MSPDFKKITGNLNSPLGFCHFVTQHRVPTMKPLQLNLTKLYSTHTVFFCIQTVIASGLLLYNNHRLMIKSAPPFKFNKPKDLYYTTSYISCYEIFTNVASIFCVTRLWTKLPTWRWKKHDFYLHSEDLLSIKKCAGCLKQGVFASIKASERSQYTL